VAAGVFVLGMHRSGTSATTHLIHLLGPAVPLDLVPPSAKNPTGYWESMSLVAFNEQILWAIGSDMRWPSVLEPGWEQDGRLEKLRGAAHDAVRQVFPTNPWVWKDPRLCLTLTFWRSVLDVDPVVVLINRNPLEIDASAIRTGNYAGKVLGFALWERYLRQALAQVAGLPVRITSYDDALSAPLDWCNGTRDFLARHGVDVHEPAEAEVRSFLDPGLRHAIADRADFLEDAGVTPAQRALFVALEELEGTEQDSFRPPALPAEARSTEALLAKRRREVRRRGRRSSQLAARLEAGLRKRWTSWRP
jgi:hypothetical protein